MYMVGFVSLLFSLFLTAEQKVYLDERFDQGLGDRWVYSEDNSVTHGVFNLVEKKYCDQGDKAIKSMNDSSYYHASAPLDGVLDTKVTPLFFHYVAQYEQEIDCGGAYIKLFSDLDPKTLTGNSPYSIMIGPDVCGYGTKTVHLIISHNGQNYGLKDKVNFNSDNFPHLISLYIGVDKSFSLKIDGEVQKEGQLKDHFDYLLPEMIDDPEDKKPEDWEDNPTMNDPEDVKPEDWDDRKEIPDPDAKKPENWDDSADGEWEPDMVKNPGFKGEWSPKQIANPKYKGAWSPKQIPNPDYKSDDTFADLQIKFVGFDLWTVKSGTVFDELFVTDSKEEAEKRSGEVLEALKKVTEAIKKENADKPKPQIIGGDEDGKPDSEEAGSDDADDDDDDAEEESKDESKDREDL